MTSTRSCALHRFHIEIKLDDWRPAKPESQMGLIGDIPPTMTVESWWAFDIERVVYEGHHRGTPEDLAVVHRLMTVARGEA